MVLTILEAEVAQEMWEKLAQTYAEKTHNTPASIVQSYLMQSQAHPMTWRIITVWRSQVDLDTMRSSGKTPTGVLIFQAAQATPTLSVFDIAKTVR